MKQIIIINLNSKDIIYKFYVLLILFINICLIIKYQNIISSYQPKFSDKLFSIYNKGKHNNSLDNPYFSIIINADNSDIKDENIFSLVSNFLNQKFRNIQIILLVNPFFNLNEIMSIKKENFEIYVSYKENWFNKIFNAIKKTKGKFTILVNNFIKFNDDVFYEVYNLIKGVTDNIFKFPINNCFFYCIRTKILRNIADKGISFESYDELINIIYAYPNSKINFIPISFCPSNNYTNLVYTSMISILSTKSYYTYILFYLVIPKDFKKENIFLLETLYEQYEYFNITFIKIDDRYNNAFIASYLTIQAYYRYSLGELIHNLDKIIYLDADTICLTDLSDFYNINFNGKMILGRAIRYTKNDKVEYFTINTGILLLNLREMRKIKFEKRLLNVLNNGFGNVKKYQRKSDNLGTDILTVDQALINIYFNKYIGLFPVKYNVNDFNFKNLFKFHKDLGNLYDIEYLYFSFKFPSIKHFNGPKKYISHFEDWVHFARKSKYYINDKRKYYDIYNVTFPSF